MFIIGLCVVITPVLSLANLSLPIEVAPVITQQCSALPSFDDAVQQILYVLDNLTMTTNTTTLPSLNETDPQILHILDNLTMTTNTTTLPSLNETDPQILDILDNLTRTVNTTTLPPLNETTSQILPIADTHTNTTEYIDLHKLSQFSCADNDSWTRVGYLDMSNSTFHCPSNWTLLETPVRGCKSKSSFGCDSAIYTASGFTYNKVCGKIIGYQKGKTNAFEPFIRNSKTIIEQDYVDGLSLTHGSPGSRKHIWTFAVGLFENGSAKDPVHDCACTNTKYRWPYSTPSFITNNYFCDSGNPGPSLDGRIIYFNNPLWDGSGCGSHSTCCQFNNPPWFSTALPQPTTDDLELRICHDEISTNENIIISSIEIYISYD